MAALGRLGRCCRSLLHDSPKGLLCDLRRLGRMDRTIGPKRNLLSEDVVKLQDFQQRKLSVAHLITGPEGSYVEVFHHKLQRNELILKDELRLLLHLCQSVGDMVTAKDAIYRYHAENKNFAFGEFKFGPLFMRLCYEMDLEEMAAATITDKNLTGFFNDATSFNIAVDMLFTKGCYKDAMEILREMKSQGVAFNKDTYMLAFAICYKLNTPDSFKTCTTLIEEGQAKDRSISRHAYCFAVALALRQNDPQKAQSLFSQITNAESRLCQNLKVFMLAMSGAVTGAYSVLSAAIAPKTPFVKKLEFAKEVIELLRLRSEDGPHQLRVEQMVSALQKNGQVTQRSLDDMLCHTPPGRRKSLPVVEDRRVSRRTLRPLQSTLLLE
ncbi:pentatricopeptide repeat-containing protein 2, mitochondrial [Gadus morhua]|nr:pentatricopeptide repeat-containing protein 2, mitochondrial [Gadus morhua]